MKTRVSRQTALLTAAMLLSEAWAQAQPPPQPPPQGAPKKDKDEEEAEEIPEEDEGPKPDKNAGVLAGQVLADSKEEVADAQVVVVGTKLRTSADFEGKWALKLPPGTYTLRIFYPGYQARRVEGVVVKAGQKQRLDVTLETDKKVAKVDVVEVDVEPDRSKASTQLMVRRKLINASDAISAQDVAKSPDRNAAEAVRRVVGVTIQQNRFVYVRGLGDRYTNSLLNGAPLPSPEPDVQAIPLDIFPVGVLANLTVLKTYSPDMPADFTGGSVRLNTRQMPTKFFVSVSGVMGINSQSTFRSRSTYDGGATDWLGSDDGGRKLPKAIGPDRVENKVPSENEAKAESLSQKGRRFFGTVSPPNTSLSAVVGSHHEVAGRPLGWLVAASYGRRQDLRNEAQALYFLDAGNLRPKFKFEGTRSTDTVTLSTMGTINYQLAQGHRLAFTGLIARRTDDEVLQLQGYEQERNVTQALSTARWVERSLSFGQLVGEHRVGESELRWQLFGGRARRDEPNFVQTVYETPDQGVSTARLDDATSHFFASQREDLKGGGLDYDLPLDAGKTVKVKVGGLGQWKDRVFGARRFRFQQQRGAGCAETLLLPADQLLSPGNLGQCITLEENTNPTDAYTAEQRILGAYVMGDVSLSKRVRLGIGTRLEDGRLSLVSRDPFKASAPPIEGGYKQTDALPSASLVLGLSDRTNLRASATRTIARPQLREVAPFAFQDFFNAVRVRGNPDLDRSKITNLDLRYEFFPTPDEVVAASVFYKNFEKPIEAAFEPSSEQTRTFENARSARNLGLELEARRSLARLVPGLSAVGNVSLIYSRIELNEGRKVLENSGARALQGQAPWVVNLAVDWQSASEATRARVAYNVLGRRIDTVGFGPLPNVYEEPRHVVDLSVAYAPTRYLDTKLALENILNAPFRFTQGDEQTGRWTTGTTAWITVTVSNDHR